MPNRTTPEFWKDDVTLNSLTRDAELLFRKIQHICEDTHRFPLIPSPQQPRNLWSALYYLREGVRISDVARWLDEIQKAGAIVVRDSERGWYGEIVERLRYRAEDFAKGVPRYGPRVEKLTEQAQLPLGPVSVLRPVPTPMVQSKPNEYDSGNGNDHESAAALKPSAAKESKTRALSSDKDSGRFARDEGDSNDELWQDLVRTAGMAEMTRNGAMWMQRIRLCRMAVLEAVADVKSLTDPPKNRGAYLTDRFTHHQTQINTQPTPRTA